MRWPLEYNPSDEFAQRKNGQSLPPKEWYDHRAWLRIPTMVSSRFDNEFVTKRTEFKILIFTRNCLALRAQVLLTVVNI